MTFAQNTKSIILSKTQAYFEKIHYFVNICCSDVALTAKNLKTSFFLLGLEVTLRCLCENRTVTFMPGRLGSERLGPGDYAPRVLCCWTFSRRNCSAKELEKPFFKIKKKVFFQKHTFSKKNFFFKNICFFKQKSIFSKEKTFFKKIYFCFK